MRSSRILAIVLAILVFFPAVATTAGEAGWSEKKIQAALALIEREYLYNADLALCEGLMRSNQNPEGCLDEFSKYLTPEEVKHHDAKVASEPFVGVGIGVFTDTGVLVVANVFEGSSAEKADIREGDLIVSVNGTQGSRFSGRLLENLLVGPKGTALELMVRRGEELIPKTVVLDVVTPKHVKWGWRNGVGYLVITSFGSKKVPEEVMEAFLGFTQRGGVDGMIIDLRGNGGGLKDITFRVLAEFLAKGETVVVTRNRRGEDEVYTQSVNGNFLGIPLVVLVDGHTASSAEIFAGVLQELGRATIVGVPTFGKGVGQTGFRLKDGSELFLTATEYLIGPRRVALHKVKVRPDIVVEKNAGVGAPVSDDAQLVVANQVLDRLIRSNAAGARLPE